MSFNFLTVLLGWLIALAIFFGFIILLRYLNHRERMALINQGIHPAHAQKQRHSHGMLRAGLIITMVGLALTVGLYPVGFILPASLGATPFHLGPWLLPGLIPLGVGIALIASYYLEQTTAQSVDDEEKQKVIPIEDHLHWKRRKQH